MTLTNTPTRFKLHLRPAHLVPLNDAEQLKPLPLSKTVEQVFGDFLRYVYKCTKQYIQETHAGGVPLWEALKNHTEFILTHPNGWEGAQQSMMRKAAIFGGLVPDNPAGHSRIHFVTEGEASLHHCIGTNFASEAIIKVRRQQVSRSISHQVMLIVRVDKVSSS